MTEKKQDSVAMGISMLDENDMAVAVTSGGYIVFCKKFNQYELFNESVQELIKTYNIPKNKIFYEND